MLDTSDLRDETFGTWIRLIGPGGAGKTTVGSALAERLRVTFVDLDQQFSARIGDVSLFLQAHDYRTYAARTNELYLDLLRESVAPSVLALSSGFMTYPDDVHSTYASVRRDIASDRTTVALLPCFDYETCLAETVRRQMGRTFARSAEREEQVIRRRFEVYRRLPVRQFETMRPVETVVDDLVAHLLPTHGR